VVFISLFYPKGDRINSIGWIRSLETQTQQNAHLLLGYLSLLREMPVELALIKGEVAGSSPPPAHHFFSVG
jgi:hypothetical protein